MLEIKGEAHPNLKVGEDSRGSLMRVLLQRNAIHNSQPYMNTFISALMNRFPDFERKRAGFPPFAWRKAVSRHVNMKWSGRGVDIFTAFCR